MSSLGIALFGRFLISAQQNDLQESFELLSFAAKSCPTEPQYLLSLGEILLHRYYALGCVDDLNESHTYLKHAYDLRIGHVARGRICQFLAAVTIQKDAHLGIKIDLSLDSLVRLYKESLCYRPLGHHSHFEPWDGLGLVFGMKFRITGNVHDLSRAINCCKTAYIMLNPQHPRAFRFSANLSIRLRYRYDLLGDSTDYELAMFHARRAVDLGPADRRPLLIKDLANLVAAAAEHSGDIEMLSEAISLAREALSTIQITSRPRVMLTLSNALITKSAYFGDSEALSEGIHYLRQVLIGIHEGTMHYTGGVLNASKALLQQYETDRSQHFHCLAEAFKLWESLQQDTIPVAYCCDHLLLLAKAYRIRFHQSGLRSDLGLALKADYQALDLCPTGHRLRYMPLTAVAEDLALRQRVSDTAEHTDLERALQMQNEAVKELGGGHPDHSRMITSLATLLLIPHTPYTDCMQGLALLVNMLQHLHSDVYRCVIDLVPVLEDVEIHLASDWHGGDHVRKECLDLYQAVINLLPRLASLDMGLTRRIQVLTQARDIATRASSHAVKLSQFDRAVELLEAGRAVFWAQHLRLRTCFDSLDSDVAKELRDVSHRLEVPPGANIVPDLDDNVARARMERAMSERRRLSVRFDDLIGQVRSQPGMGQFLRNLDYTALSSVAARGPVVIFQASWLCVIVAPHTQPQIISLHDVTIEWLVGAARHIRLSMSKNHSRLAIDRGARCRPANETTTQSSEEYAILTEIWKRIVRPLLDFLTWKVSQKKILRIYPILMCAPETRRPTASASILLSDRSVFISADSCSGSL
jgi:tetratricopeptide (TPR) repeat protein